MDTYRLASSNGEMSVAFLQKGNPNITWETNTNFNAGIEFGVLQNRISGSIEYFNRKTTDMLMAPHGSVAGLLVLLCQCRATCRTRVQRST